MSQFRDYVMSEGGGALAVTEHQDVLTAIAAVDDAYSYEVRALVRWLRERERPLSIDAVREWIRYLRDERHLAPKTVNKAILAVRRRVRDLFRHSGGYLDVAERVRLEDELGKVKLMRTTPAVRADKVLAPAEVQRLCAECADCTVRLVLRVLAVTGCRISEALGMLTRDCRQIGVDTVQVRVVGKGSRERFVQLPLGLYEDCRRLLHGATYLLEGPHGKYNAQSMTTRIRRVALAVLGKPISAHVLRHSFITAMIPQWGLSLVSKYAGHSSTAVTSAIYDHAAVGEAEVHQAFAIMGV